MNPTFAFAWLTVVLAGCGSTPAFAPDVVAPDPVTLEAVALNPGRFDVDYSGGSMGPGSGVKSVCILPDVADRWVDAHLSQTVGETGGCESERRDLAGRSVSGTSVCRPSSRSVGYTSASPIEAHVTYAAMNDETSFSLTGTIKMMGVSGNDQGYSIPLTVSGKRTGDC